MKTEERSLQGYGEKNVQFYGRHSWITAAQDQIYKGQRLNDVQSGRTSTAANMILWVPFTRADRDVTGRPPWNGSSSSMHVGFLGKVALRRK
jgi:hypothetical protein